MSSMFCSMDDAFSGPLVQGGGVPLFPGQKPPKQKRRKDGVVVENFAPQSLSSAPDRQITQLPAPEAMSGATPEQQRTTGGGALEGGGQQQLQDFFPLPGETAGMDEWAKAFTLEPSNGPGVQAPRWDGSVPVQGKSTLWRQIPTPYVAPNELAPSAGGAEGTISMAGAPAELTQRLDSLTRQLESLTAPTPMQSTAELFLFVAIGLLLLLAIDSLLRFAASVAQRSMTGGSRVGRSVGRGGRWGGRTVRVRS